MTKVCDFCHSPDPPWFFTLKGPTTMVGHFADGTQLVDDGQWCACNECADAIEQIEAQTLAERMYRNPAIHKADPDHITRTITAILGIVFDNPPGKRQPMANGTPQ